jgi:(S)-mandelate dehydrogenase
MPQTRHSALPWLAAGALLGAVATAARRRPLAALASGGAADAAPFGGSPRRQFYAGRSLDRAVSIADLRAMAHRRLPQFVLEYLEGGAEGEATLARNAAALEEWRFRHRSLVDVSHRDPSTTVFGRTTAMPVAIAPTGLNGLFWPHADLRLAQAAAKVGIPFAQSTMSNDPMELVAAVPGLRHWWQLYVFGPEEIRDRLIDRAEAAGCEALVVTVDAQIYGNREWDRRTQSAPGRLGWGATFDALRHLPWLAAGPLRHGLPRFDNVIDFVPEECRRFFDSAQWIRGAMDQALSWRTIAAIRRRWRGKLILKGLLDVADVARAVEEGVDAVAISNHGGRQLDCAVAPLDFLAQARARVGERMVLIADGAMRRGTDILKAIALGADMVFVGRAALYGVAAAGEAGASRALDILREEITRDLGLLGTPTLADLSADLLEPKRASPPRAVPDQAPSPPLRTRHG